MSVLIFLPILLISLPIIFFIILPEVLHFQQVVDDIVDYVNHILDEGNFKIEKPVEEIPEVWTVIIK